MTAPTTTQLDARPDGSTTSDAVVPRGFRLGGARCGLKAAPDRDDLALVVSDQPATAAGVYTTCRVPAAPVQLDRARTPGAGFRAVVVNSGNANACTGERGLADATEMTRLTADAIGARPEEVLVLSTGIIGKFLPMDTLRAGIPALAGRLGQGPEDVRTAARGIMTTDTREKVAARTVTIEGADVRILGLAKGAGMIAPNMATMLAVVLTDAAIAPDTAQALLAEVVDDTFHCISVDGHASTNDTVLLLGNGAAGPVIPAGGAVRDRFARALLDVCTDLARAIPADGEGATRLVTIEVRGAATRAGARRIARAVAESPLVKTAVAGADPNWGRIVSAAGNAGVPFDPDALSLDVNGHRLFDGGAPAPFDDTAVSSSMREGTETTIGLGCGDGPGEARFYTCDLTEAYVRFNTEYTT